MWGNTLWDYLNAPRIGFQSVVYWGGDMQGQGEFGAYVTGITPCILADIWVQTNSHVKTLEFTPLLSVNKLLTGITIPNGQVIPFGGGSYSTPITVENSYRAIGLETVPVLDSTTLFNQRLAWHAFKCSLYYTNGDPYLTLVPNNGGVVCQRTLIADWTVTNLLGGDQKASILTANTRWFPYNTVDGLRLVPGVSAANNAALMTQVMAQKITTGVSTWLLHDVTATPNNIVTAGGSNTRSRIAARPGSINSSASSMPGYGDGLSNNSV